MAETPLLELAAVSRTYRSSGVAVEAVATVDLVLAPGRVAGVVGESGSGKSTLARLIVGLERPTSGSISLRGTQLPARRSRAEHRAIQMVFQDPRSSLNPRMSILASVEDFATVHRLGNRAERRRRAVESLARVQLSQQVARRRPGELSGGQCQRASIARALVVEPGLLIADEPTSSLDVSIQGQILNLLADLRSQLGIVLISHDIAVVRYLADDIHVMLDGRVIESGEASSLLEAPRKAYTRRLLGAAPGLPSA